MASKQWLSPAPTYRSLETYWDMDDDAPGPRCGHTLTAVAPTKSQGPRLILFGGATAIEGGASSSAPGISMFYMCLFDFEFKIDVVLIVCELCAGLAGVTNSVHSYDVLTRKWIRWVLFFENLHFFFFF